LFATSIAAYIAALNVALYPCGDFFAFSGLALGADMGGYGSQGKITQAQLSFLII